MKVGDIIKNPYVNKEFNGKPNPMYLSMITHIGSEYTTCLRCDGKKSRYYTRDAKQWEIVNHIDIGGLILESYKIESEVEDGSNEIYN